MNKQPDIFQEAEKRVKAKASFYKHLTAYLIFNGIFLTTSLFSHNPFASFPVLFGWGIGLAIHYIKVFGIPGSGVLSQDWEDREYQKELQRLEKKRNALNPKEDELILKEPSKSYRDSDLV